MSESFVVEDGYTEDGFIAAEEGIHGPLEFTYRPLLTARRDNIARLEGDAFPNAAAKELAKQLKKWSAAVGGKPLPLTEANIRSAKPRLFDKLWLIVAGYRASDPRPDAEPPAAVDLEADAKN